MTKEQALYSFFSSIAGIQAYQEDAVPTGENRPDFPYITYEVATDAFGAQVPISVNVWDRSTSWTRANALARQIAETVTRGGVIVACDGGALWITTAEPFIRSGGDESDDMIRRKLLNFTIEYITEV